MVHITNRIRTCLMLVMLGGVAYLVYAALQPKVIFIVDETDKQMAQAAQAWKYEFELALNYTVFLERTFAEKERLYNLCNDYVYPRCPENETYTLALEKTRSMLPEFYGGYQNITGFKPEGYALQVCDVVSFDVLSPVPSLDDDGKVLNLTRIFHRIVGKNGTKYITRGDVNDVVDNFSPQLMDIRWVNCK